MSTKILKSVAGLELPGPGIAQGDEPPALARLLDNAAERMIPPSAVDLALGESFSATWFRDADGLIVEKIDAAAVRAGKE